MKTLIKTAALSALALLLSCNKKETKTEEPQTGGASIPKTDTVISFRIGLYPPAPGRKAWSNPIALVVAGSFKSEVVAITAPTISCNGSSPCKEYNWSGVGSYNLRFRKGTTDTIILRNFEAGTTNVNLQGKYVLDFTVSPPKLNYAGSSDHLVICDRSTNSVSFGDY